ELDQSDLDNVKMFALRLDANLSRRTTRKFARAFRDRLHIETVYLMHCRIALLSGIMLERYDCCRNSCVAFLGEYKECSSCPKCQLSRWNEMDKPYAICEYLPIIPRLQGYYQNPEMVEKLLYRSQQVHVPGVYNDFFDGLHYQELLKTSISTEDVLLARKLFEDPRDIALGLLGDGVQVFKKAK
ncbi:hypothetical protein M422DRAFT_99799, partial [Sphaerobolus stellatus SS14]